jgi:hypothetical protein
MEAPLTNVEMGGKIKQLRFKKSRLVKWYHSLLSAVRVKKAGQNNEVSYAIGIVMKIFSFVPSFKILFYFQWVQSHTP